jgi:pimeloyl-ACP methyl ester carboxylesterase
LVWGTRDTLLPLSAGRQTHAAFPAAQLHAFRTGHVVFASDPAAFLNLTLPFIESARRNAAAAR